MGLGFSVTDDRADLCQTSFRFHQRPIFPSPAQFSHNALNTANFRASPFITGYSHKYRLTATVLFALQQADIRCLSAVSI